MVSDPSTSFQFDGYQGHLLSSHDTPALRDWIASLENRLASDEGELIYRVRNKIYKIPPPPLLPWSALCVKRFAPPSASRRRRYARAGGKGARSFRAALHLHQHGVGVPAPLAYYEKCDASGLVESVYLSAYADDTVDFNAEQDRLLRHAPDYETYLALLRRVATEVKRMHDCGFVHNDLAGQNILLHRAASREWDRVEFIDLNRGRILSSLSLLLRARDLARLQIPSNLRRVFFHLYFGDAPIPKTFQRWERLFRLRTTLHNRSRSLRHPLRRYRLRRTQITHFTHRMPYRDMWLWDAKSGQPAIMLMPWDRLFKRDWFDLARLLSGALRHLPSIRLIYRRLLRASPPAPRPMRQLAGISLDPQGGRIEDQLALLQATPGLPVLIRAYHHLGEAGLDATEALVDRLVASGHEVSLGIIQARTSVLQPDQWDAFLSATVERLHAKVAFIEIGHAVNRVKWGLWSIREIVGLWRSVGELRRRFPAITLLGPAVNDFEYQYFPPLLTRLRGLIDGASCHLYVDRCGAPENFQGRFSTREKSLLGRAIAQRFNLKGFYITEVNWPLAGSGTHSPVQSAYVLPGRPEYRLHVDDITSAAYMIRFFLLSLCEGGAARVWWWRLAGRGIGLVNDFEGFQPRPGWHALVFWHREVSPAVFLHATREGNVRCFHFDRLLIAYATQPSSWLPPADYTHARSLTGAPLPLPPPGQPLSLSGQPLYLFPASAAPAEDAPAGSNA